MTINLETLTLIRYSETEYHYVKEDLEHGTSSSKYIHQIGERLEQSKDNDKTFQSAFVVLDGTTPVGYVYISSMINDEIYLEYAILKEFRQMGYASDLVNELSVYLFENHNIRSIKLDIDPSNQGSILVAEACGFSLDEADFESRNFQGKMKFVRDSHCYISKRRNHR